MSANLVREIEQHLSLHLGFEAHDIAQHVVSMPNPETAIEYLEGLLGPVTEEHSAFYAKVKKQWRSSTNATTNAAANTSAKEKAPPAQKPKQIAPQKPSGAGLIPMNSAKNGKSKGKGGDGSFDIFPQKKETQPSAKADAKAKEKTPQKANDSAPVSQNTPTKPIQSEVNPAAPESHESGKSLKKDSVPKSENIVFSSGVSQGKSESRKAEGGKKGDAASTEHRYELKHKAIKQPIHKSFILPGRHFCDCQASKHDLIGNCLRCGKIVCSQEGVGPCSYCGFFVGNKSRRRQEPRNPEAAATVQDKKDEDELAKARQHRDRLLHFDQTSAQRTVVYDDQADYYQIDIHHWMTPEEREEAMRKNEEERAKRHEAKRNMVVTFDIAGRRVLMENTEEESEENAHHGSSGTNTPDTKPTEVTNGISAGSSKPSFVSRSNAPVSNSKSGRAQSTGLYHNPTLETPAPIFFLPPKPAKKTNPEKPTPAQQNIALNINRIQTNMNAFDDEDIDAFVLSSKGKEIISGKHADDRGLCLSMHQPWASLLVYGIKKVEGRNWYHDHRGPLWIASASHKPSPEDIQAVESQCVEPPTGFPKVYPTSMLLGRVIVDDCVDQDEYNRRVKEKDREVNSSNYLFMCSNYARLRVPIPVSGQHKIWNLDPRVLKMAQEQDLIKS